MFPIICKKCGKNFGFTEYNQSWPKNPNNKILFDKALEADCRFIAYGCDNCGETLKIRE